MGSQSPQGGRVTLAALGGAVTILIFATLQAAFGVTPSAEVGSAVTTVVMFLLSLVIPQKDLSE